jgi:G3E family GTPase
VRTPLIVVTGVDPTVIDAAMLSLSWDLPQTAAVRHRIDPVSQVLTRTVSHAGGVLEHEDIALQHACVTCALREDIVPTLERLGRERRWGSIVAALPAGTEASQLAHLLASDSRLARHLRLSSIITALGSDGLVDDLLSDDLLRERGWHTNPGDDRGVGETACAQIELADVIVLPEDPRTEGTDLLRALARPDSDVVTGVDQLDGSALVAGRHQHKQAFGWSTPALDVELAPLGHSRAWRLDLSSPRPFHPERLVDQIERLGTGRHRSRGCFWLPTRPESALEWSGAGGQLSIGSYSTWTRRPPRTRLVFTGLGTAPADLVAAFEDLLVTAKEARLDQRHWDVPEDGLEPWLGDIRDVA